MKTKKSVELPWHPNFRDLSALPDIKVVRSVFFVNFVALTATLILTGIWLFVELQIATLTDLNKGNENQINFMGKNNKTLLAQSAEFEKMAKSIGEIQNFLQTPFKPSGFLTDMGNAREGGMVMKSLSYTLEGRSEVTKNAKGEKKTVNYVACVLTLSGTVGGTSAQATSAIESFRDSLPSLSVFKSLKMEKPALLKNFERDRALDIYTFTITLELRT